MSKADKTRAERLESLRQWLLDHGATFEALVLTDRAQHGLGFCATAGRTIVAGEDAVTLPVSLVLTSDTALCNPNLGPALAVLDGLRSRPVGRNSFERVCVYVLLMFSRMQGSSSRFAAYINALPGTSGEVLGGQNVVFAEIGTAISCPERFLEPCLKGTCLYDDVKQAVRELEEVYTGYIMPLIEKLRETGMASDHRLQSAFSREMLLWAYSCFWSRALVVPIPWTEGLQSVRKVEAMVPLVDLLNHKPGILSEFELVASTRKRKQGANACEQGAGKLVLKFGRKIEAGEQVYINYGCKGNAELLMYYGFTFGDNPADVYKLDLGADSRGEGKPLFLYRGSCFAQVLDAARALNAKETDKPQTIREIYGEEAGKHYEESQAVTWDYELSSVSVQSVWESIGTPLCAAGEARTFTFLLTRLRKEQRALLPQDHNSATPAELKFIRCCRHYRAGMHSILEELVSFVTYLQGVLNDRKTQQPSTNTEALTPPKVNTTKKTGS